MTWVGITGHQRLDDPGAWGWVASAMEIELGKLRPPLVAVTSLAIGADQLLARLVLERNGRVHAVLPFAGIERSFKGEDLARYRELAAKAELEILNVPGTEEDAYLVAGRRVVRLSDVVVAVWDGEPAKGKGGTADVVAYARKRRVRLIHIDPVRRAVRTSKGVSAR